MRPILIAVVAVACASTLLAQQKTAPSKPKTVTLSGCVQETENRPGEYTFASDKKNGGDYRLTGIDVRDFVGKRVEIVGTQPKVVVKGGLYPSPNVAAQAGAMDPAKAATAAAAGGPAATTAAPLPEFRIQSIKPVAGTCPQR